MGVIGTVLPYQADFTIFATQPSSGVTPRVAAALEHMAHKRICRYFGTQLGLLRRQALERQLRGSAECRSCGLRIGPPLTTEHADPGQRWGDQ